MKAYKNIELNTSKYAQIGREPFNANELKRLEKLRFQFIESIIDERAARRGHFDIIVTSREVAQRRLKEHKEKYLTALNQFATCGIVTV